MKKQDITDKFNKQLIIENYSTQIIKNYLSALKIFLDWVENSKLKKLMSQKFKTIFIIAKRKSGILIQP